MIGQRLTFLWDSRQCLTCRNKLEPQDDNDDGGNDDNVARGDENEMLLFKPEKKRLRYSKLPQGDHLGTSTDPTTATKLMKFAASTPAKMMAKSKPVIKSVVKTVAKVNSSIFYRHMQKVLQYFYYRVLKKITC